MNNYEVFYFDNFLERYAATKNKAIVYFRAYGWNNSSNIEEINNSMEFYKEILPTDLFIALKNSEFVFMEIENIEETVDFLETNFPESQETTITPEKYIHYTLYNSLGQTILSN